MDKRKCIKLMKGKKTGKKEKEKERMKGIGYEENK